ncbi:DNA polymerase/3'-5' exonuclease PolX [Bacillus sp. FSL W7-1360]
MDKKQAIHVLELIALYLEIKGENPFKIAAYRKAAQALEREVRALWEIEDVSGLNGIGKATAEVLTELQETGTSSLLTSLAETLPESLLTLLRLPGLGGKKIGKLYRELGVIDEKTLLSACEQGKVRSLAGFGAKSEEKIITVLKEQQKGPDRFPIEVALSVAATIEVQLERMPGVARFSRAGSLRRMQEMVKDIDFVIATDDPHIVRAHLLQLSGLSDIIAQGETKVSVSLQLERGVISVDFRLVTVAEFATALHHFTGSKTHNIYMRQLAKKQGEKISEYGVTNVATNETMTFQDEQAFFSHFNLPYMPPEAREDESAFSRYAECQTDVWASDAKADLHMHTVWSDGANTIEEMVEAARSKGYTHIAITDHSRSLKVAHGLSTKQLQEQHEKVRRLDEQYTDIHILTGIEMDILPNGTLDYPDEVLKEIDFVIASIHSGFSQSRSEIMYRMRQAIENPYVHLIAHPTGRLIGRRPGYDIDVGTLIDWAKEAGKALELNANPRRLDLEVKWLKQAALQGVPIAINSDAHRVSGLDVVDYGYAYARKAMLTPDNVLNTWSFEKFRQEILLRGK